MLANPFLTTGYQGAEYFCDREEETNLMLENLVNGRSTTLTSIRRMGKTGLIRHVLANLPDDYIGIYTDILPSETMGEFLNILVSAVFNSLPEKSTPGEKILDFIKSLRPVISYDPLTGQPQVTIELRPGDATKHIDSMLKYLDQYPKKVIIAIDEFQQILEYPEKNADSWLRSIIQSLSNVRFIFAGSQQHLMAELFSDPSRPFYQSTSFLKIGKIKHEKYAGFIGHHFNDAGKQINEEVINEVLEWTQLHTYYVQLLCNSIFSGNIDLITSDCWKERASWLLQENELIFFRYRDILTKQQWLLLKAIAHDDVVYLPTSKEFVAKHNLGSPATVLRSLQSLQLKGLIYNDYDNSGDSFYCVYDLLFKRWIQRY
ncbi:MAG: ATP-binding protein [Bacteroidales bacterium]|nr:ATP-binding protein [Bacteroidales bacterium]